MNKKPTVADPANVRKNIFERARRIAKKYIFNEPALKVLAAIYSSSLGNGHDFGYVPDKVYKMTAKQIEEAMVFLRKSGAVQTKIEGDIEFAYLLGGGEHKDIKAEAVFKHLLEDIVKDIQWEPKEHGADKPQVQKTKDHVVPEKGGQLDWAFRRMRRQALLFFGKGRSKEDLKALREAYEAVPHSYLAFRGFIGEQEMDTFLEHFFGHVIHPGARS